MQIVKRTMAFNYGIYSGVAKDGNARAEFRGVTLDSAVVGCKRFYFKDSGTTSLL